MKYFLFTLLPVILFIVGFFTAFIMRSDPSLGINIMIGAMLYTSFGVVANEVMS